jgi:hypothetical protein
MNSDGLVRKAITFCAVYNNNWRVARQKYTLTSNALYTHYHLSINSENLKKFNQAISDMVKTNENVAVTPQKQDELRVTYRFYLLDIVVPTCKIINICCDYCRNN